MELHKCWPKSVLYQSSQKLKYVYQLFVIATCILTVFYQVFFNIRPSPDRNVFYDERGFKYSSRKINFSHEQVSESPSIIQTSDSNASVSLPTLIRTGNYTFDTLQPISDHKLWVYSAFFDSTETDEPIIKVIGIALRGNMSVYYCQVHDRGDVTVTIGQWFVFEGGHEKQTKYDFKSTVVCDNAELFRLRVQTRLPQAQVTPVYVSLMKSVNAGSTAGCLVCYLRKGSRPDLVSVTTNKTEKPTNHLTVIYPGPKVRNITVCYPVLHSLYNEPSRLIMSIEFNQTMGADHAFIYNYSVSREINYVLKKYQEYGFLTILHWPLPSGTNAWYWGQNAVINDCVYRNRNVSQYVAVLDVDEFIVPVNRSSFIDLIQDIMKDYYGSEELKKAPLGSMGFESSVFNRKLPHDIWKQVTKNVSFTKEEEDNITRYSLFPFLYLQRSDPPYKFPSRGKSIVRPDLVTVAGTHSTHHLRHGAKRIVTNNKQAIVNHYSISEMKVGKRVLDVSILRLKHLLFPRLQFALSRFSEILK